MTTKTELLNNGVVVATKTAAPFYFWDWTPATSGASSLTYKRYEDNVLVFTSSAIIGTVDAATSEVVIFEQFTRAQSLNAGEVTVINPDSSGWTSAAYSTKAINGVGEVTFTAEDSGILSGSGLGLSENYSGVSSTSSAASFQMDILLLISSDTNQYTIFQNGTQVANASGLTNGQVYKLKVRSDGKVEVIFGTTIIYTSTSIFTMPMTAICLLNAPKTASKLSNATFDSANLITSPL